MVRIKNKLLSSVHKNHIEYNIYGIYGSLKIGDIIEIDMTEWLSCCQTRSIFMVK